MKKSKSISFTIAQLKKLPCAPRNKELLESLEIAEKRNKISKKRTKDRNSGKIISKLYPGKSKQKNFIESVLFEWTQQRGILLYGEYIFHDTRKFRFDWCVPDLKIAFEYEGIYSEVSRHTSIKGYNRDVEKYNEAQKLGWKVFRYTALNFRNVSQDLINY